MTKQHMTIGVTDAPNPQPFVLPNDIVTATVVALGGKGMGKTNLSSVWTVPTAPYAGAHFATFPPELIRPCIRAGSPLDGVVLDPFGGAGTTGLVADQEQRQGLLIELNPEYAEMARQRIVNDATLFTQVYIEDGHQPGVRT